MSRTTKFALAAIAAVVVIAGAAVFWFLSDDAPTEVSLEAAAENLNDDSDTETTGSTVLAGIDGTWTVDAETGEFDYESASGSFVGFRIEEELSGIGSVTAVGRTGDVTGTLAIADGVVTDASFEVDMTTITTNDSRRDDKVQFALDSPQFPTASFVLTSPIELGSQASAGDSISVTGTGELTIHGVTRTVDFPLEAQLVGDTVVVVGSIPISFADYDVEVPPAQIIISVEDNGILELQLLFTK